MRIACLAGLAVWYTAVCVNYKLVARVQLLHLKRVVR